MNLKYRGMFFFVCTFIFLLNLHAQKQDTPNSEYKVIDTVPFQSSAHHWYDIYEKENVVNAKPHQPRYKPTEETNIADNILLYQRNNGGWPKNYDMLAILTEAQKDSLIKAKNVLSTTFDNSTTYSHVAYLAKVYDVSKVEKYKDAALRGIDFILLAQYDNGGWPQSFPLKKDYSRYITFNDDAMTGIMKVLKEITDNKPYYSFIDKDRREKIKAAFNKGIDCILKCQVVDNGVLTAWCQQHDEIDLRPVWARAFEPPSICNLESAEIVLFLMSINKPGKEIVNSIQKAIKWFEDSKIYNTRVKVIPAPYVQYKFAASSIDRIVVEDKTAPPIWTRYYELGTHKPLFSNRKSEMLYSLADVDRERRSGYTWYTYEPQKVLNKYAEWKKKL